MSSERLSDAVAHALVETAPDGIVIVDESGDIVFVNRTAEELFDYDSDEIVGAPVEVLMPSSRAASHRRLRTSYHDDPVSRPMGIDIVLEGRRKDGSVFPAEIALSPLQTAAGPRVVASVRDVTARRRAQTELQAARSEVATLAERERIARDLHDTVIQHLFAVGMNLQTAESQIADERVAARVRWAIDHLDETIREVRSVIFELRPAPAGEGLRNRVLALASEANRGLGFEPRVRFDGLIDAAVPTDVGEHLLAALREALANVARHAGASHTEVLVATDDEVVVLRVVDDGRGISPAAVPGHGISNMQARAEELGGTCTLRPGPARGTIVVWRVPLGDC